MKALRVGLWVIAFALVVGTNAAFLDGFSCGSPTATSTSTSEGGDGGAGGDGGGGPRPTPTPTPTCEPLDGPTGDVVPADSGVVALSCTGSSASYTCVVSGGAAPIWLYAAGADGVLHRVSENYVGQSIPACPGTYAVAAVDSTSPALGGPYGSNRASVTVGP